MMTTLVQQIQWFFHSVIKSSKFSVKNDFTTVTYLPLASTRSISPAAQLTNFWYLLELSRFFSFQSFFSSLHSCVKSVFTRVLFSANRPSIGQKSTASRSNF